MFLSFLMACSCTEVQIIDNYGEAAHETPPCSVNFNAIWSEEVVSPEDIALKLYNTHNCTYFKLFNRDLDIVKAIHKSVPPAQVIIGFNNWELNWIASDPGKLDYELSLLLPYRTLIYAIAVGNEPLGDWYRDEFKDMLSPAVEAVCVWVRHTLPKTHVTVPFNFAILETTYPPSMTELRPKYANAVRNILSNISKTGDKPFMLLNIYPYLTYLITPGISLDFAIGRPSLTAIRDGPYTYTSLFPLMYDSAIVMLEKEGFDVLDLKVGEVGWPSYGGIEASTMNECFALSNLRRFSAIGSPRKNGPINLFLFEAIDEPWKLPSPGLFERHWGILDVNGTPKCETSDFDEMSQHVVLRSSATFQQFPLFLIVNANLLLFGVFYLCIRSRRNKQKAYYIATGGPRYGTVPQVVDI